jgi:hypothetical protein
VNRGVPPEFELNVPVLGTPPGAVPALTEARPGTLIASTPPTPRAVTLVLLPALILTLAFAFSYVGAFHDPTPHQVPVAVVGPPGRAFTHTDGSV